MSKATATKQTGLHAGITAGITDCLAGNNYRPEPITEGDTDYLDGYSYGWGIAWGTVIDHAYIVQMNGNHGYPYRASCPCGWQSNTYAAAHAAHTMGEDHIRTEAITAASK